MANLALPSSFLPSDEQLTTIRQELQHRPAENNLLSALRASAYERLLSHENVDKELERFFIKAASWQNPDLSSLFPVCQMIPGLDSDIKGVSPELALVELPLVEFPLVEPSLTNFSFVGLPPIDELLSDALSGPRSIAHAVVMFCDQFQIIICKDGQTVTLADNKRAGITVLIVEPAAQVTILARKHSELEHALTSGLLVVHVGEGAQVTYKESYKAVSSAYGLFEEYWTIDTSARVTIRSACAGQTGIKKTFRLHDGASLEQILYGAFKDHEQSTIVLQQIHEGAASKSRVHVRSIVQDHARAFFRGTITIKEEASQSEAHLQHRALHLSDSVMTCAIPSLEVAIDDVLCSHGSAVSTYNEDAMQAFYLRGLQREQAHRLLINGFYHETDLSSSEQSLKKPLIEHLAL